LTATFIVVFLLIPIEATNAFETPSCNASSRVVPGDLSWITPVAGEASARVALMLPGPGVLTVEAVAGERADARAWVDVLACPDAAGPRPVIVEASFARRSVWVEHGGVVTVVVGTLTMAAERVSTSVGRLTLTSRFEPATLPGLPSGDPEDDGDGTEESNNEILPIVPAPGLPAVIGLPAAAGMEKMEEDDDGDGTEESNNEILPTTPPPPDPPSPGLEMGRMVLSHLDRAPGPVHADHLLVITAPWSLSIPVEADGPVRLDLITASGHHLASAGGKRDHRSVVMSPTLPSGRYFLRVVGEAGRSLRYGIRIDRRP
jgi:hypothetical protein